MHLSPIYRRATHAEYLASLDASRRQRGDAGLCVADPDSGADLFLSADGLSGYALEGGNLGSVFSSAKGRLSGMIRDAKSRARRAGEHALKIDCFEPLAVVYERHGFERCSTLAFDWAYAPAGWTKRHGEPDVVFMSLPIVQIVPVAGQIAA